MMHELDLPLREAHDAVMSALAFLKLKEREAERVQTMAIDANTFTPGSAFATVFVLRHVV